MGLRQAPDDDILGVVGILVLVDQNILELLLVTGQHVGAVAQQDVGLQQQVVEIHGAVALATLAIGVVDIAELGNLRLTIFGRVSCIGEVSARRYQRILGERDARSKAGRLVLVVVEVPFADDGLQQVLAVRRLVDRERLRKTYAVGVLAQDAREDRMERTHADIAAATAGQHLPDARAHLFGGFIGKGKSQDVERRHPLFDHVGDARRQDARLARAGAGDDERRGVVVFDRRALGGIETI